MAQNKSKGEAEEAAVVVSETSESRAVAQQHQFVHVDIDSVSDASQLPDLDSMPTAPVSLVSEYWTPEPEAEGARTDKSRRNMFFIEVRESTEIDENTGEEKRLKAAFFLWRRGNSLVSVRNSSARLVGAMEDRGVPAGQGLEITYLGKVKNKTNAFMSDNWDVKPKAYSLPGAAK